jgi:phosphoglucosamine mutase
LSDATIRFGTDGVRACVGEWPLTAEGVRRMGKGIAAWAADQTPGNDGSPPTVVIGRDTRASGVELEDALVEGLVRGGGVALRAGVLPTAAVSCAVVHHQAAAGVMLTASHNPWHDNGVKVLRADGKKPGAAVAALEAAFEAQRAAPGGRQARLDDAAKAWRDQLPDVDLSGTSILLDCASGAGWGHAESALRERGARVVARDAAPDGRNINADVGALHPPSADDVRAAGCDMAICLDGDADRVVLVDAVHGVMDGDDLLWLLCGATDGPVIGTVMTNGGLEAALGGRLVRTPVGDQHVAAAMGTTGALVGAEPSGHVLFHDGMPTGDGLYSALRALAAVSGADGRLPLPLPASGWTRWPVASLSVRFTGPRLALSDLTTPPLAEAAGNRLVVRYSGTEPKLRVLAEGRGQGDDAPEVWARKIIEEFEARRGA